MNTKTDSPGSSLSLDIANPPDSAGQASKTDDALASLEKELNAETDARKEERFVWIVVCTLLVDVIWFRGSSNAAIPVLALVLELVVLFVVARRMQIDEITLLMSGLINTVGKKVGGGAAE